MRRLWHTPARFFLILWTVVPIYFSYFWLWAKKKWFGKSTPSEKWSRIHTRNAKRFYKLAVRMRGGLIKVGQIISTRVDIVPKEWTTELSALQDKVDPTPWKVIQKRLTKELGTPPDELFEHIDHEAVAAASFGQVHRARTKEGEDVALKIQYQDVGMKLACDLFVLNCAIPFFNIFVPKIRLRDIYDEIQRALETELDYRQEAEYTRIIRKNMQGIPHVVVPEVVEKYTTEFVICTTYFEGFKATDVEQIRSEGFEVLDVIQKIIRAYASMFFIDGVFQSDPHPGNLLLHRGDDGQAELCILDFGQVKILPPLFKRKLIESSVAFMGRDVDNFAKSIVAMGVLSEKDVEVAKPILKEFFEELYEMSPNELKQLDPVVVKEKIEGVIKKIDNVTIPTDIVLYGRAFGLLAGVIAALDPDVNGIIVAKPMIMEALMRPENFAPLSEPEPEAVAAPA